MFFYDFNSIAQTKLTFFLIFSLLSVFGYLMGVIASVRNVCILGFSYDAQMGIIWYGRSSFIGPACYRFFILRSLLGHFPFDL